MPLGPPRAVDSPAVLHRCIVCAVVPDNVSADPEGAVEHQLGTPLQSCG